MCQEMVMMQGLGTNRKSLYLLGRLFDSEAQTGHRESERLKKIQLYPSLPRKLGAGEESISK